MVAGLSKGPGFSILAAASTSVRFLERSFARCPEKEKRSGKKIKVLWYVQRHVLTIYQVHSFMKRLTTRGARFWKKKKRKDWQGSSCLLNLTCLIPSDLYMYFQLFWRAPRRRANFGLFSSTTCLIDFLSIKRIVQRGKRSKIDVLEYCTCYCIGLESNLIWTMTPPELLTADLLELVFRSRWVDGSSFQALNLCKNRSSRRPFSRWSSSRLRRWKIEP